MGARVRAALCLVVLLAGCNGGGTGDRAVTTTPTVTPAPIPTSPPTETVTPGEPTGPALAPGVTVRGVEDPFALAGAHRQALSERSFRLVRTLTVTGADGTLLRLRARRATVAAGASRYLVVDTAVDTGAYPVRAVAPRIEVWWAGGPALFRLSGDGEPRYRRAADVPPTGPAGDLTLRDRIAGLLSAADTAVVGREPGETVGVVLVAKAVRNDAVLRVPVLLERPRNVSMSLTVGVDGVVREYRIAYDATFEGERVRVVRRVRFAFVEGPVEPPAWRDRALNASGVAGPGPDTPGS